jgi:hypothetical protein
MNLWNLQEEKRNFTEEALREFRFVGQISPEFTLSCVEASK